MLTTWSEEDRNVFVLLKSLGHRIISLDMFKLHYAYVRHIHFEDVGLKTLLKVLQFFLWLYNKVDNVFIVRSLFIVYLVVSEYQTRIAASFIS